MTKLEIAQEWLESAFQEYAGKVGLFFSGGSDSLLLLHMMLEHGQPFAIVCFDHTFSREQRKYVDSIIAARDLRVFSYQPSTGYLIGDGHHVSLVEEYEMLGVGRMPFIKDVAHNPTRCAVEDVKLGPWHEGKAPVGFGLNIFGTRKTDRHYATGKAWPNGSEWSVGPFAYAAPLWDWTRRDVKETLKAYGIKPPVVDTGTLPMCLNCLCGEGQVFCPKRQEEIDAIQWDPQMMLEEFRKKHIGGSYVREVKISSDTSSQAKV